MIASAIFHNNELKGYRLVTDVDSFYISADTVQSHSLSIECADKLELISSDITVPNISYDVQMINALAILYKLRNTEYLSAIIGKSLVGYLLGSK